MQPQPLDIAAVQRLAVAKGIDSQSELARLSGITESHLSRILNGRRNCRPSHVLLLSKALGCDPDAILLKETA